MGVMCTNCNHYKKKVEMATMLAIKGIRSPKRILKYTISSINLFSKDTGKSGRALAVAANSTKLPCPNCGEINRWVHKHTP